MSISVVQTKSADSNSTLVTTLAVTFDAAPTEGSLLRAMLVTRSASGTLTPPNGWTLEASDVTAHTPAANCYIYYKIAGASEPATVTFLWVSARRATLLAREYSGIDTASPFSASASDAATIVNPHSTGTTGTIGAGDTFAEAWFGVADTSDWTATRTYTNSYVEAGIQEEVGAAPAIYTARNTAVTPGGTTETSRGTSSDGNTAIWGRLVVLSNGPLIAGVATVLDRTATTVSLSATDASGGTEPYEYLWHRSTTEGFTPDGGTAIGLAITRTLEDSGLTEDVTYYYRLEYTDDDATVVYSDEVSVTTSGSPFVVITDFDGGTSGIYEIMGPGIAVFNMFAGSFIGTGVWRHAKIEWDFGNPSGEFNEHRGFSGGHFYDVEPEENTDYTVTCTVTNSAGLSTEATRTVRVTPNNRRKVFIDPDDGSATPVDPTDSDDPYDTIASCIAAETETDLEIQLTASKTHVWAGPVGGTGSSNVWVRSTVKGTKFNITPSTGLISGGDSIIARDASVGAGTIGSDVRLLDQRSTTPYRCGLIDCESVNPEMAGLITGAASRQTLLQNVTTQHSGTNDYWLEGDEIVLHNVRSENYTGNERPYRGPGDDLTMNQCYGEYQASDGKSVFTKSGGTRTYIDRCTFEVGALATNGSSTCFKLGHNTTADVSLAIVERSLFLMKETIVNSEVCIEVGTTGETAVHDVCIRNCIMDGARSLVYCDTTGAFGATGIDFFHNTLIVDHSQNHVTLQAKYGETFLANNLMLGYTTKNQVAQVADSASNDPMLTNNVAPVATTDDDINHDGAVVDWATFNATALGAGNLSKNIAYSGVTYRPTDTADVDLLKAVLAEMGAVPEDYYGNVRAGGSWVAGAVGDEPEGGASSLASASGMFFFGVQ